MANRRFDGVMQPLAHPAFAWVWGGQALSNLGDSMFSTALAWHVGAVQGSATAMSMVLTASVLPVLLFSLIGGVTVDKLARRKVLLAADLGRGVAALLLAVVSARQDLPLPLILALVVVYGIGRAFHYPAMSAFTPEVVPAEALPGASALVSMSRQVARIAGPGVGVILYSTAGLTGALTADGISFLIAVVCTVISARAGRPVATDPGVAPRTAPEPAGKRGFRLLWNDVQEALRLVGGVGWLWWGLVVASLANATAVATISVSLPGLVSQAFESNMWPFALFQAVYTIGGLVTSSNIGWMGRLPQRGMVIYLSLFLLGGAFYVMGATTIPILLISFWALGGIFGYCVNILWTASIQQYVPGAILGRISSLDMLTFNLLGPLGYIVVGRLSDWQGPGTVFRLAGVAVILLGLVSLALPMARNISTAALQPRPVDEGA